MSVKSWRPPVVRESQGQDKYIVLMYLRDQRAGGHREADTARDGMPESVTSGPSMEQLGEQAPRGGEESCRWADGDKIPSPADLPWHATGAGRRCLRSGDCTDDRRHRGSARTGPSAGGEQTTCQLPRAKNSRQPSDICHLPASCPRRRADARPDPADLRPRQCVWCCLVFRIAHRSCFPPAQLSSPTPCLLHLRRACLWARGSRPWPRPCSMCAPVQPRLGSASFY